MAAGEGGRARPPLLQPTAPSPSYRIFLQDSCLGVGFFLLIPDTDILPYIAKMLLSGLSVLKVFLSCRCYKLLNAGKIITRGLIFVD